MNKTTVGNPILEDRSFCLRFGRRCTNSHTLRRGQRAMRGVRSSYVARKRKIRVKPRWLSVRGGQRCQYCFSFNAFLFFFKYVPAYIKLFHAGFTKANFAAEFGEFLGIFGDFRVLEA